MGQSRSLSALVFRNYLRSALIPVLTIELLLVVTYFLVNAWNTARTEKTLRRELTTALPFLAENRAETIDASLARVAAATRYFAEEHQRLEADPQRYRVAGDPVVVALAPNGTRYQANRKEGSGLYYPTSAPLSPRQLLIGERSASLDSLYRHMVTQIPNVAAAYYNTWDNTNRLYPYIEKVWEQYPPTLRMADFNFYYTADSLHNPGRTSAWTGAYLDPAGQGWMVSCVAPVYLGSELKGVVGLDLTVANLVNGILSLRFPWGASAFLDGQDEPVPTRFSLSELIERIRHEFEERAAARGIELAWEIAPGIEISSHKEQIYHGIVNLVKNSMEAIDGPGRISATLVRTADGSRLVLEDTGCGMDEEELARAQTAGFTTKAGGHGLGLHSFSVFLSSRSSQLRVESPGKGKGSRIAIEFAHA